MRRDDGISEVAIRKQAARDGVTYLSTGVAIVRGGKMLVVRRAGHDFLGGSFELPGGGVDAGETILESAIREVKEETGLLVSKILGTFHGFDYATDRKPHVRQADFLVVVEPGDVHLDPNEHDKYLWVDEQTVHDITMSDEMRTCIEDAFRLLSGLESDMIDSRVRKTICHWMDIFS